MLTSICGNGQNGTLGLIGWSRLHIYRHGHILPNTHNPHIAHNSHNSALQQYSLCSVLFDVWRNGGNMYKNKTLVAINNKNAIMEQIT
jgi:hypothetical protein